MEQSKDLVRAKKAKKSLSANLEGLDIYSKFKVRCTMEGITIRTGLREAVIEWLKKYDE